MKRFFDVILSLLAVLVLLPILLIIMLLLKLTGEHYIFYSQKRIGRKNEPFNLLKFATMLKNSPNMKGGDITTRKDPRVLPMGGFLRKTKLNELPQIFNIIRGEMSIVGPRPLTKKHFDYYSPAGKELLGRMTPGLTGIGSILFRDEEIFMHADPQMDNETFYGEKVAPYKEAVECWYYANRSLLTDFKIIFLTAWVIPFPESQLPFQWFKNLPPQPKWMKE